MDWGADHLQHVKGVLVADVLKCKWLQQRNCEASGSSCDWPLASRQRFLFSLRAH